MESDKCIREVIEIYLNVAWVGLFVHCAFSPSLFICIHIEKGSNSNEAVTGIVKLKQSRERERLLFFACGVWFGGSGRCTS